MKKIMGIATLLVVAAALAGCHHHKKKDYRPHKGNHSGMLPGDKGKQAPNCAADGPGCRQFNPNR